MQQNIVSEKFNLNLKKQKTKVILKKKKKTLAFRTHLPTKSKIIDNHLN